MNIEKTKKDNSTQKRCQKNETFDEEKNGKKTQKDIKHKPVEKNCNEEKTQKDIKHKKHIWSFSAL